MCGKSYWRRRFTVCICIMLHLRVGKYHQECISLVVQSSPKQTLPVTQGIFHIQGIKLRCRSESMCPWDSDICLSSSLSSLEAFASKIKKMGQKAEEWDEQDLQEGGARVCWCPKWINKHVNTARHAHKTCLHYFLRWVKECSAHVGCCPGQSEAVEDRSMTSPSSGKESTSRVCGWALFGRSSTRFPIRKYTLFFEWRLNNKKKQEKKTHFCSSTFSTVIPCKRELSVPGLSLELCFVKRHLCCSNFTPGISITYAEHGEGMPMIVLQPYLDAVTLSVMVFIVAWGWGTRAGIFCCHFNNSHLCFHLVL